MSGVGLYVHVPFCRKKCPYCDFYSLPERSALAQGLDRKQQYVDVVCQAMKNWERVPADTLYFGGGTPVQLLPEQIGQIIAAARERFSLEGEITVEANPGEVTLPMLQKLQKAGVNRLSFGMQSANEAELQVLGRRHSAEEAQRAVSLARQAGFDNLSVDLMLGVPYQTVESLSKTLDFVEKLSLQHVSAYLLKIEEGTPFAHKTIGDLLPDEDTACDCYLLACRRLEEMGLKQYEISNFARPGWESRHNLKYWRREEYLAFGPSAHGFFRGKRYEFPRDLEGYLQSGGTNWRLEELPVDPLEESLLLGLRLREGICPEELLQGRAGQFEKFWKQIELFCAHGLMRREGDRFSLTPEGFLVSNSIITQLELALEE